VAKIYRLKSGDKVHEEILRIAREEKYKTARVEAIGGFASAKIAYFNHDTRRYEEHLFEENLEVTSMLGNITLMDGVPYLHLHSNLGRRDMSVIGGHLVSAEVHPFLEVVITPTTNTATRKRDRVLGLNAIYEIH